MFLSLTIASLLVPSISRVQGQSTCQSLATQEQAQGYFDQTRQQRLDKNGDGTACESPPRSPKLEIGLPQPVIVSTGDGDTLRLKERDQVLTVRLGCIDAPERRQTGGAQSAAWLKQKLPVGQVVQLRFIDQDKSDRVVGEIFLDNRSVNLWAVEEGMAVVYPEYLNGCPRTKYRYLRAEEQAQKNRLGFWKQDNPIMPWEYRRQNRTGNESW
jgi:endonuclease YncB( thermonuclease family)